MSQLEGCDMLMVKPTYLSFNDVKSPCTRADEKHIIMAAVRAMTSANGRAPTRGVLDLNRLDGAAEVDPASKQDFLSETPIDRPDITRNNVWRWC